MCYAKKGFQGGGGLEAPNGNQLEGTGEKFSEKLPTSEKEVELFGEARAPIRLVGNIDKRLFFDDKISIVVSERGFRRDSSSVHCLLVISDDVLQGNFKSTVAQSSGNVTWKRL
ncbi:hypothetical protein N9N07_04840 [Pseudomonadales bacterium]|nr:hypothetical protein [Pseudomonadales bacterium]